MRFKTISTKTVAFALGAMLALSVGVFSSNNNESQLELKAEKSTLTDEFNPKGWGGYTSGSFLAVGSERTDNAPTSDVSIGMGVFNGSTGAVRGNQSASNANFWMRNQTSYPGAIVKITLSVTGGTLTATNTARNLLNLHTTAAIAAPGTGETTGTTVDQHSATGLATVTWTIDPSENYRFFRIHHIATSDVALAGAADAIIIEYEEPSGVVDVTGVSLNKNETSIERFKTEQLTASVEPFDASNQNVTWSSNNESVATVSSSGLVSALNLGVATITVETVDGEFTDDCVVTVTKGPSYFSTDLTTAGFTLHEPSDLMSQGMDWTITMDAVFTGNNVRGVQFGTGAAPATYLSITSELFVVDNDALIKEVIVYGETASGGSFDLDVFVNGEKFANTKAVSYVAAGAPQEFVFENVSGMYGHIEILYTHKTSHALYFHSVKVYADTNADLAAALNFADDLEDYKTCSEATAAHTALSGTYNGLSSASKTYLETIKLFDYDAGDTTYAGSVSLQVIAANKWAGILAVHGGSWPSSPAPISLGLTLGNNMLVNLLAILIISSISAYAYSQLKKRYNNS